MEWWILILSSLLFKPEWGSANITQVTDVVTAAPAKRNRHATIICSITSLNIDAKVFSKDPFATCSRPMCSLKERITMDDELEDACKRLRSAASRYNTIPLLFAESHKWEEIYNSSDNHNTYTSGTENEKQELLRDIAREFQSVNRHRISKVRKSCEDHNAIRNVIYHGTILRDYGPSSINPTFISHHSFMRSLSIENKEVEMKILTVNSSTSTLKTDNFHEQEISYVSVFRNALLYISPSLNYSHDDLGKFSEATLDLQSIS
ncbi:hypothetical protein RB195_015110 [Necator americanus]|uniref:Uncharacterized protein n=1 Tax=Necator americanus TaxID=51031 RepID=A0ABR1E367_NECAM